MGGHPQAQTPNIDRLAARGVLFNNAHCQSPVCNPSRASMMTSLYPSTTGVYFLSPDLAASPVARKNTLMPKRFEAEGYHVTGAGKLFHGHQNKRYFPNYAGRFGGFGPSPEKKLITSLSVISQCRHNSSCNSTQWCNRCRCCCLQLHCSHHYSCIESMHLPRHL